MFRSAVAATGSVRVEIIELGHEDCASELWDIEIVYNGSASRKVRLTQLWDQKSEQEFLWYLEIYASDSGSPFEKRRAERVREAIIQYGDRLCDQLSLLSLSRKFPASSALIVQIAAAEANSSIFKIHWEVLQRSKISTRFSAVYVQRTVASTRGFDSISLPLSSLNILLVTARAVNNDIDHLLVAERLIEASDHSSKSLPPVNVEIVRPGTWEATKAHLERSRAKHGPAHFQVVHIDVHGFLVSEPRRKGVYLSFLHQSGKKPNFVRAEKVATELRNHGVRAVILNACRSASVQGSGFMSLPDQFLGAGIDMVIGMMANVSLGAIRQFTEAFYGSFLTEGDPWSVAVTKARDSLAANNVRDTRLDVEVELDDWLVPVFYLRRLVTFTTPTAEESQSTIWRWTNVKHIVAQSISGAFGLVRSSTKDALVKRQLLIGRNQTILQIENALFLPVIRPGLPDLKLRQVHIHGIAGSGKTALARYLCWWWSVSRLVDVVLWCECGELVPWSTARFQSSLLAQVRSSFKKDVTDFDAAVELIQTSRVVLVLEDLEYLDLEMFGLDEEAKVQLAQLLGTIGQGETIILTVSRTPSPAWLIIPRDLIYPIQIGPLTSGAALQLTGSILDETSTQRLLLTSSMQRNRLDYALEQLDYLPQTVRMLANLTNAESLSLEEITQFVKGNPSRKLLLQPESRIERAVWIFNLRLSAVMTQPDHPERVFANQVGNLALSLHLFSRRIPDDAEIYVFLCSIHGTNPGGLALKRLSHLLALPNSELLLTDPLTEGLAEHRRRFLAIMQDWERLGLVWKETVTSLAGRTRGYWHMHPVLSFILRLQASQLIENVPAYSQLQQDERTSFAHYYNMRLLDFDDSTIQEAHHSERCFMLEIDNIAAASGYWLSSWMSETLPSFLTMRVAGLFNSAKLEKREYRMMQEILKGVVDHYVAKQAELRAAMHGKKSEFFQTQWLKNFLTAAGQLQNIYFSTNDWQNARVVNATILKVLDPSSGDIDWSDLEFQTQHAQAKMVRGWEMKCRGAYLEASVQFNQNLAAKPPENLPLSHQINFAKMRMMNTVGLWECASVNDRVQVASLSDLRDEAADAIRDFVAKVQSAPFGGTWTDSVESLLTMFTGGSQLQDQARSLSAKVPALPVEQALGYVSGFKSFVADAARWGQEGGLQGFALSEAILRPNLMLDADPQSQIMAVVTRITEATNSNVDSPTLVGLYQTLSKVAIQAEDFEQAQEVHKTWRRLALETYGELDNESRLWDAYATGVCTWKLGDPRQAKQEVTAALALAERLSSHRILLSCLFCDASLSVESGDFEHALRQICLAGKLAYRSDNDIQWDKPGNIVKGLINIGILALGFPAKSETASSALTSVLSSSSIYLTDESLIDGESDLNGAHHDQQASRRPSIRSTNINITELMVILKQLLGSAAIARAMGLAMNPSRPLFDNDGGENKIRWDRLEKCIFAESVSEEM